MKLQPVGGALSVLASLSRSCHIVHLLMQSVGHRQVCGTVSSVPGMGLEAPAALGLLCSLRALKTSKGLKYVC